jgi:hypothetical protein
MLKRLLERGSMTGPRPCQTRGREGQNTSITLWGVALGHVPGPAPARDRANRRGPRAGPPRAPRRPGPPAAGVPPGRARERAGLGSCVGCGAISCALRMIFVSYPGIVDYTIPAGASATAPTRGRPSLRSPAPCSCTSPRPCVSGSRSRDRHDKGASQCQVDFCIFHRIFI